MAAGKKAVVKVRERAVMKLWTTYMHVQQGGDQLWLQVRKAVLKVLNANAAGGSTACYAS